MRLSDIGEFGWIARLSRLVGGREGNGSGVTLGIGDDAALFQPTPGCLLVATADMLVEEVHFRRDWTTARDLGWKSLAVNVSDCAAMGAEPRFALVCIGLEPDTPVEWTEELYAGMQDLAGRLGVRIAGGDTVRSHHQQVIAVTVVGEVEPDRVATRAGARPGDALVVTGTVGDSGAGCAALLAGPDWATRVPAAVLDAHRRPWPRVAEARAAIATGGVTALIDLSDGLASDIRRIGEQSGVGAEIDAGAIPVSAACREAAGLLGRDPLDFALRGGEDYELLFAVAPERVPDVCAAIAATGTPATVVGAVTPAGFSLRTPDGARVPLPGAGFEHFPG